MADNSLGLEQFLALSGAMLGLDTIVLNPRNTPIHVAEQYLDTLRNSVSIEIINKMFGTFADRFAIVGPEKAAGEILDDDDLGPIARSIIKLWLLSTWYDPLVPTQPVRVVSSQAYKEGLVWKVMQAHPMGYSMWTFGYWADPPPDLEEFLPSPM